MPVDDVAGNMCQALPPSDMRAPRSDRLMLPRSGRLLPRSDMWASRSRIILFHVAMLTV